MSTDSRGEILLFAKECRLAGMGVREWEGGYRGAVITVHVGKWGEGLWLSLAYADSVWAVWGTNDKHLRGEYRYKGDLEGALDLIAQEIKKW